MTLIRFILGFSLITYLVFLSQSLPTSAADDGVLVSIPFRRSALQRQQPVKAVEKVADAADCDHTSFQPRKLGVYMRKTRGGSSLARSARRTSSAVRTHLSSFHFGSILGCSLFLGLILF